MLTKSQEAIHNSYKDRTGFTERVTTECNTQPMQTLTISGTEDFSVGQATPAVDWTLHQNVLGKILRTRA